MQLLDHQAVLELTGYTKSGLYAARKRRGFPLPVVDPGPGRGKSPEWDRAEVRAWMAVAQRNRKPGEPAKPCQADGCDRDAVSVGLCLKHWKQKRRGHVGPVYKGSLRTDGEGRLICEECGRSFESLSSHVRLAHGVSVGEYRAAFDLPPTTVLWSESLREQQRERSAARVGSLDWERFEVSRNPRAASEARTVEAFDLASDTKRRR